jgi:hypothetical protein
MAKSGKSSNRLFLISQVVGLSFLVGVIAIGGLKYSQNLQSHAQTSTTVTLGDTQDAWVNSVHPTENYGHDTQLSVREGNQMTAYITFDLSSLVGKRITSAKLRMHVCGGINCGSAAGQNIKSVIGTWNEQTITYKNKPLTGKTIGNFSGSPRNTWIESDVSNGVIGLEGNHGVSFEIDQTSADGIYFDSKEAGAQTQPQLVVTYSGVGQTAAPTATPKSNPTGVPTANPTPISTKVPVQTPSPTSPVYPTLPPISGFNDPIIFFNGDLVSVNSVSRAQKVVALIKNLMAQHAGTQMLVASTGDNEQESTPTLSDYQNYFGTTYQVFVNMGIFRQIRGNHDVQDAGHGAAYAQYFGANSFLNADGLTNYSYNLGTWHIIGLDELNDAVNPKTLAFLQSDLAANTKYKCQIVYWHVPTYSSGSAHGDAVSLKPLNQAEYAAGVDIQINGHDHDYQRFYPINPDGVRDDAKGITTFIDGIGGEDSRSGSKTSVAQAASALYMDSFNGNSAIGVVMFTLHANSADYALYDANSGSILDHGTVYCH